MGCTDFFDPRVDGLQIRLAGHKGLVMDIALHENTVITAGDDCTVKLFDLRRPSVA